MKQIHLLKYYPDVLDIFTREAKQFDYKAKKRENIERFAFRTIRNKILEIAMNLQFSKHVELAFKNKASITDVDGILYVNGRIRAIFELKRRVEDYNKLFMVNARQFFTLRKIARRLDVPLVYLVKITEYPGDFYRIMQVDDDFVKVRRLGRGHAQDNYAVWPIDCSTIINGEDVPEFLRGLI